MIENEKVLQALKTKMWASRSISLFEMPGDLLCIIGTLHLHCSKTQNVLRSPSFVSEFWAIMQIWTWRNWALKVLDHYLGPFYTRSQCWNRKKNFNLPQVTINAELYGLVLAPRLKKGFHQIWEANLPPLGPMFQHLLISWRQCSSIY